MTTPANRAPKFVVLTAEGLHCGSYATEQEARNSMLTSDCTIHPIGPALPGPDRDGTTPGAALYNTMTPGSPIAWVYLPENHRALWETRASAVIAAHDAGRETERVDRWAVFDPDDETWWDGDEWNTDKSVRALYARYSGAAGQCSGNARAVRITTRRRRVVKS